MGRRKGERGLADSVFKMAKEIMVDNRENLNLDVNRPFHHEYLSKKLFSSLSSFTSAIV